MMLISMVLIIPAVPSVTRYTRHLLRKIAAALIAFGPWGVFLLGFIDSLGVPLPAAIDALLITVAIETPERAYFTAFMAVLGSAGGNIALFMLARSGRRRFMNTELPPGGRQQRFQQWFSRYGLLTVFVPAVVPFVPLPLKVFVISAGAMHTPVGRFLAVVLLARVVRYFGEAWLGIHLGGGAQDFLVHHAWSILGGVLAVALTALAVIRFASRRSPPAEPSLPNSR
jgi:membrane protein YqaA with SNARE-associated domain